MMRWCGEAAVLVCVARAAVDLDLVDGESLPGYRRQFPDMGKHYSGYVTTPYPGKAGVIVHTHYYLVLHASASAPVVMWQQGGPGGSSLIGMLTEMGPLTLNDASFEASPFNDDGPAVFDNEHGWQSLGGGASLLFLEHPAPTGFSWCEPACSHDDDSQSTLSMAVLEAFFGEGYYPELASQRFVATGESYAGVLVPTLALQILERRTQLNQHLAPYSLEGWALGNDCPGNGVFTCTPYSGWAGTQISLEFLYGHGSLPDSRKREIDAACKDWYVTEPPGPQDDPPPACAAMLEDPIRPAKSFAGDTYDFGGGYFLYDTCGADLLQLDPVTNRPRRVEPTAPGADRVARAVARRARENEPYALDAGEYACGQENAAALWLNRADVQRALHVRLVDKDRFEFSTELQYEFTRKSLLADYNETLVKRFRILQYTGDADPCVPHLGTQRWIESLKLPVTEIWRPYTAPDTMPVTGYVTEYATAGGNFMFATVRDAGHMSPRYKPKQLKYLITQWLQHARL